MEMVLFASVIFSEKEMQLSSIKSVDKAYPLIGELELRNKDGEYATKKSLRQEQFGWMKGSKTY